MIYYHFCIFFHRQTDSPARHRKLLMEQ